MNIHELHSQKKNNTNRQHHQPCQGYVFLSNISTHPDILALIYRIDQHHFQLKLTKTLIFPRCHPSLYDRTRLVFYRVNTYSPISCPWRDTSEVYSIGTYFCYVWWFGTLWSPGRCSLDSYEYSSWRTLYNLRSW